MQGTNDNTEARERVLDAAERLFAQRGYTAVTLRDIAAEVGIRHASLYHHAPGGKEQLFIEVTERNFQRHHAGLKAAIQRAEPDVRSQLVAVADWLLSQPPMDIVRMVHSDMPAIDRAQADRLSELAYELLFSPIIAALTHAQERDEIAHADLALIAAAFFGLIESLYGAPDDVLTQHRHVMARTLVDVLLNGLRPR